MAARKNPLDDFKSREKNPEIDFRVNAFPKLAQFVNSFGLKAGVQKFDEAMEAWRKDHERNFPIPQITKETVEEIVTAAAVGQGSSSTPTVRGPTEADFEALLADFSAHILADVVHRKDTPVLGESDEQIVEKKTIGQTDPRYGRFTHVIQNNFIRVGESLTIPVSENMIVAGPFEIAGELIVDGYFASVDTPPY